MTAVRWADLEPGLFERLVTALIKGMHASAERIDGRGGDRGREIQIRGATGLELFQLKSFTGRLTTAGGRRKQVERSLVEAAKLNPTTWSLVVPIDPTPGERDWSDNLGTKHSFALHWLGENWLDREVAQRPYLTRYFLENQEGEVVRLLTLLHQEKAALAGGVPDALERVRKLADLLNNLDPYYRFELTAGEGRQAVTVIPRYPGAEVDSPTTVNLSVRFPDDPEGRKRLEEFQSAFAFGTGFRLSGDELNRVIIRGPAGLGGEFSGGEVVATPLHDPEWRLPGRMLAIDVLGAPVAAIAVTYTERTTGSTGFTVTAWDQTHTLRFHQTVDQSTGRADATFHFETPEDAYPSLVLPVLRFLRRLRPPNQLALEVAGQRLGASAVVESELVGDSYFELLEALDRVQAATSTYFAIPPGFTADDVEAIEAADRLLRGEGVSTTWRTFTVAMGSQEGVDELLANTPGRFVAVLPAYTVEVAGLVINLGQAGLTFHQATIEDRERLEAAGPLLSGHEHEVRLVPAGSDEGEIRLQAG